MEIPDAMLNTQVRQMMNDFASRMQSQGLDYGAVLPVHRNDSREDAGRDETAGSEENPDKTCS